MGHKCITKFVLLEGKCTVHEGRGRVGALVHGGEEGEAWRMFDQGE